MPTYRAPPDERTKGLLRILVADKFTGSQISEIADLFGVPPPVLAGGNKSDRAGSLIRRLTPALQRDLVAMVFGDGFVHPGPTAEPNLKAEAALRAACVVYEPGDPPSVEAPSSRFPPPRPPDPVGDFFEAMSMKNASPASGLPARSPSIGDVFVDVFEKKASAALPSAPPAVRPSPADAEPPEVFVVHGHNVAARESVARLILQLGLKAIVLKDQASEGRTVIEKFEKHASRGAYAVVLLTADDIGGSRAEPEKLRPRARENALFELGYFVGRLGRSKVCAMKEDDVEIPSDLAGVVYVAMDSAEAWKVTLAKEMKAAGLPIDLNRL